MNAKDFRFSTHVTLVTSHGVNSVGKTSLIRLILHALGEPVPQMQGFSFKKLATRLEAVNDLGETVVLIRRDKSLLVRHDEEEDRYALPYDSARVREVLFGVKAASLGDGLLACYFIDQDKGWTLLNRGKAIGDISFSIEDFISTVSGADDSLIKWEIAKTKNEIEKYQLIANVVGYRHALGLGPSTRGELESGSKSEERRRMLLSKRTSLERTLKGIRRVQKDNSNFRNYVDAMKLKVRLPDGSSVLLTKDNLAGFDDNDKYADARALSIRTEIAMLDQELERLGPEEVEATLFEPEGSPDSFDLQIASLRLDGEMYAPRIDSLKKRKRELEKQLKTPDGARVRVYESLSTIVHEFCEQLGVLEYLKEDGKGVLTGSLKDKSGSNYCLLVFAFRLAYARLLFQEFGVVLPLIIDSPRGREMSEDNFLKCMGLLEKEFSGHQIIIASIFETGIRFDYEIALQSKLMSDSSFLTDIEDWEECADDLWAEGEAMAQ